MHTSRVRFVGYYPSVYYGTALTPPVPLLGNYVRNPGARIILNDFLLGYGADRQSRFQMDSSTRSRESNELDSLT